VIRGKAKGAEKASSIAGPDELIPDDVHEGSSTRRNRGLRGIKRKRRTRGRRSREEEGRELTCVFPGGWSDENSGSKMGLGRRRQGGEGKGTCGSGEWRSKAEAGWIGGGEEQAY
jgi:hypothetical protein